MASLSHSSSRKASNAASAGSNKSRKGAADSFDIYASADEADPDEEIAAHTLADFMEYPNDSHTAIKSPIPRHHLRSGSLSLGLPQASSFATSSSTQQDASTRPITSSQGAAHKRGSHVAPDVVPSDGIRKQSASGASASSADGFPASEAVATPGKSDSPTLGQFPIPPTTRGKKGKARDSMLLNRSSQTSDVPGKEQKERSSNLSMQDPEVKAEKGVSISLLPKFLKLAGSPRQSASAEIKPESDRMGVQEVDELPPREQNNEQVRSTFESDSSDEGAGQPYDEHAFIGGAKLAASRKPKVVDGGKSGGRRVVSMQEILDEGGVDAATNHLHRRGGSVPADNSPDVAHSKASRVFGGKRIKPKRAGIVGMPAVQETSGGVHASLDSVEGSVKGRADQQVGLVDGLRSNPVSPVKSAATARADKKLVTPIKCGDEPTAAKDSIVLTPYPPGYKQRKSGDEDSVERRGSAFDAEKRAVEDGAGIMLVLYSQNSNIPTIRKVVVPETTSVSLFDEDEKRPPFRANIAVDFDDEKLFRLVRKEYLGMKGIVGGITSARAVRGISLLGYHRLSQLAVKEHRPSRRKTFRVYDDIFTEQRMMDIWAAPDRGRKKHEWVEWIRRLPRYAEGLQSEEENVALELIEGWAVGKIAIAVLTVVVLSMLATLLWTLLGSNGSVVLQSDAMMGFPVELRLTTTGFRGAGMRVETGLALGVLVLLLGWTAVGAWVLLNWLVM
ncbi:MAG: hypothetical protein Q9208_002913 [Pyrenodesmia sp. 3 TL-2023]